MNARADIDLEEMRDAEIARLIPAHAEAIRAKVQAADPMLALIADRWTSVLGDDESLPQQLALMALSDPAMAGHAVRRQIEALIFAEAEVEATKEVEQMERERQESHDAGRIERAEFDRSMRIGHGMKPP